MDKGPVLIADTRRAMGAKATIQLDREQIAMTIGFTAGTQESVRGQIMAMKESLGLPEDCSDDDLPAGPNGESAAAFLPQQVTSFIAHRLAETTFDQLRTTTNLHSDMIEANRTYRRFSREGKITLAGAALLLGTSSLLAEGRLGLFDLAVTGSYVAYMGVGMAVRFNRYLREQVIKPVSQRRIPSELPEKVADDIHATFCSNVFEETFKNNLA